MSGGWVFKWWCNSGGGVLPMVTADFRGRWCPKWPRKLWRNMWTIPSPCQVYKLTVCWYPAISLEMTLDIFHLPEARVLSFESFWYLRLFLFRIKSHPGVCHKSVSYKKVCNVVFYSSKDEEKTLSLEFIFMFTSSFHWVDLVKKYCQKRGI